MDPWADYRFDVLGEPAQLVAKVAHRLRAGVLVLTDTRIVYLRKKKGETFIDCEFSRDAITGSAFTIQIGGRQLSIEHSRERFIVVGDRSELEPFLAPLRQNAEANAARLEAEKRARFEVEEKAQAKQRRAKIDATVGEPILHVATVSSDSKIGVLALTDTRLVYLRKKKEEIFVDREFARTAIVKVTYTVSKGVWSLRFNDGSERQLSIEHGRERFIVVGYRSELEPFLAPLRQNAEANAARLEAEKRARFGVEEKAQAKQRRAKIDATVGEPILHVATVSSDSKIGVLTLTDTRLVYLRKKKEEIFVDREFARTAIVKVTYTVSKGVWSLRFNDGSDWISYDQSSSDLAPLFGPLEASANANTATDFRNHHVTGPEVEAVDESENYEREAQEKPREGGELILNPWGQRIIGWTFLALIAFGIYFFATNSYNDGNEVYDPCLSSYAAQEACADNLGRQLDAFDGSKAAGHSNADAWATSEATR